MIMVYKQTMRVFIAANTYLNSEIWRREVCLYFLVKSNNSIPS